jgi:hypothetical protein
MSKGLAIMVAKYFFDQGGVNQPTNAFRAFKTGGSPIDYFNALKAAMPYFRDNVKLRIADEESIVASKEAGISSNSDALQALGNTSFDEYIYDYDACLKAKEAVENQKKQLVTASNTLRQEKNETVAKLTSLKGIFNLSDDEILKRLTQTLRDKNGSLLSDWPVNSPKTRQQSAAAAAGPVKLDPSLAVMYTMRKILPKFFLKVLCAPENGGWIELDPNDAKDPEGAAIVEKFMGRLEDLFRTWKDNEDKIRKYHPLRSTRESTYRTRKQSALALLIALDEESAESRHFSIVPGYDVTKIKKPVLVLQLAKVAAANSKKFKDLVTKWILMHDVLYADEQTRNETLELPEGLELLKLLLSEERSISQCFYEVSVDLLKSVESNSH